MDLLVTSANPFIVEGLQFSGGQIREVVCERALDFNIRQSSDCADPGYSIYDGHLASLTLVGAPLSKPAL